MSTVVRKTTRQCPDMIAEKRRV